MIKVATIQEAWELAHKLADAGEHELDKDSREQAGYPIYRAKESYYSRICDLGCRLEVVKADGTSTNIWIEPPVEATATSNSTEETEDTGSATKEERRETAKRIQRLAYFYTVDYVQEMDNKKREDAAVKEMQAAATEGGEIKCMVLTAENNARIAMGSITDCIAAVDILVNMEEDVEDWMIAGINAMLDKVRVTRGIPFDLSTAICGVLGAQYR